MSNETGFLDVGGAIRLRKMREKFQVAPADCRVKGVLGAKTLNARMTAKDSTKQRSIGQGKQLQANSLLSLDKARLMQSIMKSNEQLKSKKLERLKTDFHQTIARRKPFETYADHRTATHKAVVDMLRADSECGEFFNEAKLASIGTTVGKTCGDSALQPSSVRAQELSRSIDVVVKTRLFEECLAHRGIISKLPSNVQRSHDLLVGAGDTATNLLDRIATQLNPFTAIDGKAGDRIGRLKAGDSKVLNYKENNDKLNEIYLNNRKRLHMQLKKARSRLLKTGINTEWDEFKEKNKGRLDRHFFTAFMKKGEEESF